MKEKILKSNIQKIKCSWISSWILCLSRLVQAASVFYNSLDPSLPSPPSHSHSGTFLTGQLKQIDAGGNQFVAGVNMLDNIYCLNRDPTVTTLGGAASIPWNLLPGALKYYSCGPYSCWGVNAADQIFMMKGVTPDSCMGSKAWQQVPGALSMIEVSTDGSVHGVNSAGNVYRRDGVSIDKPAGTDWIDLTMCVKSKHVSYDLGVLWVISKEDNILACR